MAVELDEIDVKLLTALQADADRTNVELARLVGLSPAATLHRVRWLKESGVIRIIRAQLDPAEAGFPLQVYVTATLSRHDPRTSRIFDDHIRAMPQIIAADNVAGEMDYMITAVARDVAELQEDADRTNVELARMTGLSPAATLHRVRRLKETGVIRVIRAEVDPAAAGFPLKLYVTASLARHDPRSSRVFDDLIRSLPQIIAADNVAGETDYLLSVVARDVSELQGVLASLATRGGQRLVTYLRLEEIKPPSRLPLAPVTAPARRGSRRTQHLDRE